MPVSQPAWVFRASLGGQKYHASPHKAKQKKKEMRWERIKKVDTARRKKQEEVKGCLVLAEAAIPSSGGQDRLKEAEETKRKKARR